MEGMRDWERWLTGHHESSPGVWLMIAKKGSALTSVSYAEALEAALWHGWIDGQKQARDSEAWLQKFTPRAMYTRRVHDETNFLRIAAATSDARSHVHVADVVGDRGQRRWPD